MNTLRAAVNVNGQVTALREGRIPVTDRGFLYGDSVYDTFRTYDGVPLELDAHMDRLERSAKEIFLSVTQSREFLLREIKRTIAWAQQGGERCDVYVRVIISRGVGPVDLIPGDTGETTYVIMVQQPPTWGELHRRGVRLAIPTVRRNSPRTLDPNVKSGNYLNNVLGALQARHVGADDALFVDLDGFIAEGSNSNVLFVRAGSVWLPNPGRGNLMGITQGVVMQVCAHLGRACHAAPIVPGDLKTMDEGAITSATRGVMPVASIRLEDGKDILLPQNPGRITTELRRGYESFVADYVATHRAQALL